MAGLSANERWQGLAPTAFWLALLLLPLGRTSELAIVAFALTFGMPLVIEMGILFDLLIAVGVGWVTTRRMMAVIRSASTDELRRLRG